jgi:2-polyprenyl-3-methyl-5-hydroxy-6-metoxy-1,4-benzoquinol methylase
MARRFGGKRVLDYGSGDGTFLAMTMMTSDAPAQGVGAELSADTVTDCRDRYREEPRLQVRAGERAGWPEHVGQYDAVFCMEVMEHVVDWEPELARLKRLLKHDGTLIISVPVETGLPLMVKQTVRRIAGWRKIGHYPGTSPYFDCRRWPPAFLRAAASICRGRSSTVEAARFTTTRASTGWC